MKDFTYFFLTITPKDESSSFVIADDLLTPGIWNNAELQAELDRLCAAGWELLSFGNSSKAIKSDTSQQWVLYKKTTR